MKHSLHLSIVWLSLLAAGILPQPVAGQPAPATTIREGYTTEGREFWVVFQKNFRDYVTDAQTQAQRPAEPLQLELFITSNKDARGTIQIRGLGFNKPFQVQAGKVITIAIDTAAQVRSSERVEDLAVHIVSDEPIAVYGLNRRYQTTDTYLAYPVNVLGTRYRAMGYQWLENDLLSQVAMIATRDSTTIRITPTVKTQKGKPAGIPFEVRLNRGEVYQVMPKYDPATPSDLTGSLIEADAPIAIFSGHNCAYVPDLKTKACNLLVEQLPPLESWGRQFFVGTLAGRSSSALRILAQTDSTHVFENNRLVATLPAGGIYENKNQTQHTMVSSDEPVLLAQYSKGFDNGDNVGDPMMIVVAPTEQFLSSYRFATPVRGSWHHYINVIAPTTTLSELRIDGKVVDTRSFKPFGLSLYSIGQIEVSYGTHVIEGPEPFGLYSYGFGFDDASYDAYGNGGGQSMERVIQQPDTAAPKLNLNGGSPPAISAIIRDDHVNDRGLEEIQLIDYDNMSAIIPGFETGAPQVQIRVRQITPQTNAYAQFKLRDRAGNVSYYTICVGYDPLGDSLQIRVLTGNQSCDFSRDIYLGGMLQYGILDNGVNIPTGDATLRSQVPLAGNRGVPNLRLSGYAEMPYTQRVILTGRISLGFLSGDALGYFPDSLQLRAPDGVSINEEFRLHRSSLVLTLSPGIEYYFSERKAYVFGLMNISVPLYTSETYTRTIISPSNYLYAGGNRTLTEYDGSGPSGLAITLTPEVGIGAVVELRRGWRVFGELGVGHSLTSISPDRDWTITYPFSRFGVKMRL